MENSAPGEATHDAERGATPEGTDVVPAAGLAGYPDGPTTLQRSATSGSAKEEERSARRKTERLNFQLQLKAKFFLTPPELERILF